jgi:hypothetical protein
MKKMKKKILGISLLLILMSCALESIFGLPNDEKIDENLIGVWVAMDSPKDSLEIKNKGDFRFEMIISGEKDIIEGYTKKIKGFTIMNLIIDGGKGEKLNTFYGVRIKNDTLEYSEVSDKLRKTDFSSQKELIRFFEKNISRSDFFINPERLIRK